MDDESSDCDDEQVDQLCRVGWTRRSGQTAGGGGGSRGRAGGELTLEDRALLWAIRRERRRTTPRTWPVGRQEGWGGGGGQYHQYVMVS